jgi:MGT family glycosyltransferase
MKNVMIFSIPAHGHTNPILPVAKEIKAQGNNVRFYSFDEFKDKIEAIGVEFISCTKYLPEITAEEEANLKRVSATEMANQSIKITLNMDEFIGKEVAEFQPDVIYTDSACFWGKLTAIKYNIPMVVSTSTFAFNQLSSKYMKNSLVELWDMIGGLPKISRALKAMKPYGYHVKSVLDLVQSKNETDSIVYTSKNFQPYVKSFSKHYAFVGPSIFSTTVPNKVSPRPLVYISMGTVINDRPEFYNICIDALKDLDIDVIISCGNLTDPTSLRGLSDHIKIYQSVNQLEVLSRANAFITHCGMNSVSEALYMATPLILFPQTGEQYAVARKASEIGAGALLKDETVVSVRATVQSILQNKAYAESAQKCREDFLSCSGPTGAADFIMNAPHKDDGVDVIVKLNKKTVKFQLVYWTIFNILIILFASLVSWKFTWIPGVLGGILNYPITQTVQLKIYKSIIKDM